MATVSATHPDQAKAFARQRPNAVRRSAGQLIGLGTAIAVLTILAIAYLAPLFYIGITSFKTESQLSNPQNPLLPVTPVTFSYQGKDLPLYNVPQPDGSIKQLALVQPLRYSSVFIDPQNVAAGTVELKIKPATLAPVMRLDIHTEIYAQATNAMNFPRALLNTLAITLISAFGAVSSASLVAYGFSRFRIPGGGVLFVILMATIILPPQVTLIPTFIVFQKIGWTGTLLPLIVPHFFSNAYNVFLLRQYFLQIPTEMDEAAKVDGANPLQVFWYVVIPQARAALVAVTLFHCLFAWNEFYQAYIFTAGNPDAQPLSVALNHFRQIYSSEPNQLMAGALLTMIAPLVLFFLAQKVFMQGIVITGVEK